MNWIIAEGLRRYGFAAQADALVRDSLALIEQSDFREYYDPRDGSGCGATDFCWSAALALEMLAPPDERTQVSAASPGTQVRDEP